VAAIGAATHPHHFLSVTKQGIAAIVATRGNPNCHVILRGSSTSPNYDAKSVGEAADILESKGIVSRVMVDCSHGNSSKQHERQAVVADDIAAQLGASSDHIFGVMIESHLVEGRQNTDGDGELTYGQSITDACLGWDQTVPVLERLAAAVQKRRENK